MLVIFKLLATLTFLNYLDERALIHCGATDVGQAAISICQYYECDLFVTVDNNEEKGFLLNAFNIPENRIFCNKDNQFKYRVKQITGGKGVDIVFIARNEENLEVGIECMASGGRIVNVGKCGEKLTKISIHKNISIMAIDVMELFSKMAFFEEYFAWIHKNCDNGMIKPIITKVFNCEQADKAFKSMANCEHIGKVVIRIRDEENHKMIVSSKTFFDPKKVYIITGGLGGMGLELVHWMLFLGARNFVLTSRYGVKTDYQKFVLKRLKSFGEKFKYFETNIVVTTVDTNTIEGAKSLISDSQWLGQIGGVFHLALVLNDRLLVNQTLEEFHETYDTKAKSCHNLDQLSRELDLNLDYFVVFSSQGSGKGNGGQTNYGYGLSECELICETRRRDGLHGLAIQWGPIGDVGVIADIETFTTLFSVDRQRIHSCFEKMDKFLQTNMAIISSIVSKVKGRKGGIVQIPPIF